MSLTSANLTPPRNFLALTFRPLRGVITTNVSIPALPENCLAVYVVALELQWFEKSTVHDVVYASPLLLILLSVIYAMKMPRSKYVFALIAFCAVILAVCLRGGSDPDPYSRFDYLWDTEWRFSTNSPRYRFSDYVVGVLHLSESPQAYIDKEFGMEKKRLLESGHLVETRLAFSDMKSELALSDMTSNKEVFVTLRNIFDNVGVYCQSHFDWTNQVVVLTSKSMDAATLKATVQNESN